MPTTTPKPIQVETVLDVAYLPDGQRDHTLDLYLPGGKEGPLPTLLMFHGGRGDKADLAIWGNLFANQGFAAFSINYRQWPDHQYPSNLEDATCALSWIIKNQESYQLNLEQVFFLGHSAGGTLAASLGIVEDLAVFSGNCPDPLPGDFQAAGIIPFTIISDYPTAGMISNPLEDYIVALMGGTYEELPELWEQASPANWVDGDEPPFLLIHGLEDLSIPPSQSQDFADLLVAAGGQAELLLIPDANHMQIISSSQSMDAVEDFISRIINSLEP